MNHYKRNNGALIGALGVVVAMTMTAALGLVFVSQYTVRQAPSVTSPRSEVCAGCGSAPSVPSAAVVEEPELMRLDRACEHHG